MLRLRAAAALLLAVAGAAQAADDFSALLARRILEQVGADCAAAHPDMAAEVDRVRAGWLAKNRVALAEYDARFAALPESERKATSDRFALVATAWHDRIALEEANGNGAVACTNVLVRYESDQPLPPPAAPAPAKTETL
jgi:hypothetical protein